MWAPINTSLTGEIKEESLLVIVLHPVIKQIIELMLNKSNVFLLDIICDLLCPKKSILRFLHNIIVWSVLNRVQFTKKFDLEN